MQGKVHVHFKGGRCAFVEQREERGRVGTQPSILIFFGAVLPALLFLLFAVGEFPHFWLTTPPNLWAPSPSTRPFLLYALRTLSHYCLAPLCLTAVSQL
jgi:hypothetical protein